MVWIRGFADMSVILLVIVSAAIAGIYRLVKYDNGSSIQSQTQSLYNNKNKLAKEVKSLQSKLENMRQVNNTINQMGSEFDKFLKFIPDKLTSATIMNHLNITAKDSGVDLQGMTSHQSSRRQKKDDFYETVRINVVVKGFFSQILSFLSRLTGLSEIITVESFVISHPSGSRKKIGSLGEVQINMDIFGYRYIDTTLAKNKL